MWVSLNNKRFAFSTVLRCFPANCAMRCPGGRCARHLKAPEYLQAHSSRFRALLRLLLLARRSSQAFSFLLSHIKFTKIVLTPFKLTSMCCSLLFRPRWLRSWFILAPAYMIFAGTDKRSLTMARAATTKATSTTRRRRHDSYIIQPLFLLRLRLCPRPRPSLILILCEATLDAAVDLSQKLRQDVLMRPVRGAVLRL